ncbi:hypothetical protein N0M98_18890 [Paenibacillus doosanensis]|uniref:Uncharacterized protein n=1 Tax=Paenibacillus konkukensis TaxID=2020716 RepID=A0ABY4RNM6_9BACL|nr:MULTISPECIES: hypothetical protein [Paenibacillus]MCS7462210.1 hypothetical protein [Paenibacillus doosanensis]UQZ82927.1 hypothetical protein SK3146_02087 [Paenibacillus konkukensis]
MSYDFYYWSIMSAAFIATNLVGVLLMLKTKKMLLSFLVSLFVDLAIFVPACLWWASLFEGFSLMFGLFGYGIAFVNTEILLAFALFVMKKKAAADEA